MRVRWEAHAAPESAEDVAASLESVTVRFGDRLVLDKVDLTVARASIVSVEGPSGSGKSSVLNLLGGLIKPSAGRVLGPGSSTVQWVHQDVAMLRRRSALDNVAISLLRSRQRRATISAACEEALEGVGLAGRGGQRVSQLSGGELQRVAIARAVVCRPALLLADEPTGQLDRETTISVIESLFSIARIFSTTVILATHDQAVADRADARYAISNGRLGVATQRAV